MNPQKVRCFGPGLDPKGVRKGQPALFTVDATQAGDAPCDVFTTDQRGEYSIDLGPWGVIRGVSLALTWAPGR